MERYIKISELAKKVGVSRQAIYRRLDKDLKRYVMTIDGVKKISVDAIDAIKQKEELSSTVTPEIKNVTVVTPSEAAKIENFEKIGVEVLSTVVRLNSKTDSKIDNAVTKITALIDTINTMQKKIDELNKKIEKKGKDKLSFFKRFFGKE
ncbi:MAG: HTH domain-containing protein [Bacteroidales bacterium]|nr:HTH domain-containing protein [Bacteroidales bacterium]